MDDALEMDDVYQLVDIFPALTKANSQRLLEILKARKVSSFLDASTHLYKRVRPSVRRLWEKMVGNDKQNSPNCPKMSNADATLFERTC